MKTKLYLTILSLVFSTFAYTQIINIPDANFKYKLLHANSSEANSAIAKANWSYSNPNASYPITIDVNNDGEIQQSEALAVSYLNVIPSILISDVTGIEFFTNLRFLSFGYHPISNINLAPLTQMESLWLFTNQLTNIDLAGLTNLKIFYCAYNQINTLDFSGLPNLKTVYCGHNLLTSLDFSGNPLFEDLGCEYNPNLTTIKIKNNHTQLYGSQTYLNQCWGGNPNLNYICADAAEIPALQSFLASCNMTQAITIDSACVLGVEGFEQEVGVFPNPTFSEVFFDNTSYGFDAVSIYNYLGQEVATSRFTSFGANQEIDMSTLAKGVYILKFKGNQESQSVKIMKQ